MEAIFNTRRDSVVKSLQANQSEIALLNADNLRKMMEDAIPSELYNLLQKVNKIAEQYRQEKWKGRRHRRELQRQYDKLYKRFDHYCKIYGVTYSVAH